MSGTRGRIFDFVERRLAGLTWSWCARVVGQVLAKLVFEVVINMSRITGERAGPVKMGKMGLGVELARGFKWLGGIWLRAFCHAWL